MFLRYTHCCISQCITSDTCVRFADNQPAPKGNVAGHCGGPGASPRVFISRPCTWVKIIPRTTTLYPSIKGEWVVLSPHSSSKNVYWKHMIQWIMPRSPCRLVDCIELDCKSISSLTYSSTQITTTRIPFAILPKFTKRGTLAVGSILDFRWRWRRGFTIM